MTFNEYLDLKKHGDDGSFEHEVHPVDDSMEKIIEGGHYINFNCCCQYNQDKQELSIIIYIIFSKLKNKEEDKNVFVILMEYAAEGEL